MLHNIEFTCVCIYINVKLISRVSFYYTTNRMRLFGYLGTFVNATGLYRYAHTDIYMYINCNEMGMCM